jgi:hypothetical protein
MAVPIVDARNQYTLWYSCVGGLANGQIHVRPEVGTTNFCTMSKNWRYLLSLHTCLKPKTKGPYVLNMSHEVLNNILQGMS